MKISMTSMLKALNEPQRQAVTTDAQSAIVIAAAGTGKTKVLVHRIAWLSATHGMNPDRAMAVTFTNKAAKNMRKALEKCLVQTSADMWIGTFHGMAFRMIRRYAKAAGLSDHLSIIDQDDQLKMIRDIIKSLQLDLDLWPANKVQRSINHLKIQGTSAQDIVVDHEEKRVLRDVMAAYQQRCEVSHVLDFTDIIAKSLWILKSFPEICEHFRAQFDTILIDEFQDINDLQYQWICQIADQRHRIFAVGDDDQSIYSWRGANVNHMIDFSQHFSPCETFRLEQNYRSTDIILQAANAIIANNDHRLGKTLWTQDQGGQRIDILHHHHEHDEAKNIVDIIKQCHRSGISCQDIAVLYRNNTLSRVIEEHLTMSGIDYHITGGHRFFDRSEIKDILAYMHLGLNPSHDAAWQRIVNFPTRGLGDISLNKIKNHAMLHQIPALQAMRDLCASRDLKGKALTSAHDFLALMDEIKNAACTMPLNAFCQWLIETTGLMAYHQAQQDEKSQIKLNNCLELVHAMLNFAQDHADACPQSQLEHFLTKASLDERGHEHHDQDKLNMMTLHAAKGLEFDHVFIVGMEEDIFPNHRAARFHDKMQEERRLCYVGITRARKQLYLSHVSTRQHFGRTLYAQASRFLDEIPDAIKYHRSAHTSQKTFSSNYNDALAVDHSSTQTAQASPFHLGQQVIHQRFGPGIIIEIKHHLDQVRVQFQDGQVKWLIISLANLQVLDA